MKKFWKTLMKSSESRNLTFLFIASIFIALIQHIYNDAPEWVRGADFLFHLSNNVIYAFIASYVFYVVSVFLPQSKVKTQYQKVVSDIINKIDNEWIDTINILNETYEIDSYQSAFDELSSEDLSKPVKKFGRDIDLDENGKYVMTMNTVSHFVDSKLGRINKYIDELQKLPYSNYDPQISSMLLELKINNLHAIVKKHIDVIQKHEGLKSQPFKGIHEHFCEVTNLINLLVIKCLDFEIEPQMNERPAYEDYVVKVVSDNDEVEVS